jgi:hypothetical protein
MIKLPLSSPKKLTRVVGVRTHSFLISALDGDELSTFGSDRLNPEGAHQYPWNKRLGGPQSRSGNFYRREKSPALTGI